MISPETFQRLVSVRNSIETEVLFEEPTDPVLIDLSRIKTALLASQTERAFTPALARSVQRRILDESSPYFGAAMAGHFVEYYFFGSLVESAERTIQRDLTLFIANIEMAMGAKQLMEFLTLAESVIAHPSHGTHPEADAHREIEQAANLLKRDQSGSLLVAATLDRFNKEFGLPPHERAFFMPLWQHPDFFMIGAQGAADAYKKVYKRVISS